MPPQINFSQDVILNEAFEIVRQEGIKALTARRIAQNLNSSTQPIYSAFGSMKELEEAVLHKAKAYVLSYLLQGDDHQMPFLNIGLQYIRFAKEETELFKTLFLSGQVTFDFEAPDSPFRLLGERMKQDAHLQGLPETRLKRILRDMWIYTQGVATLIYMNAQNYSDEFIFEILYQMGQTIIEWEHYQVASNK